MALRHLSLLLLVLGLSKEVVFAHFSSSWNRGQRRLGFSNPWRSSPAQKLSGWHRKLIAIGDHGDDREEGRENVRGFQVTFHHRHSPSQSRFPIRHPSLSHRVNSLLQRLAEHRRRKLSLWLHRKPTRWPRPPRPQRPPPVTWWGSKPEVWRGWSSSWREAVREAKRVLCVMFGFCPDGAAKPKPEPRPKPRPRPRPKPETTSAKVEVTSSTLPPALSTDTPDDGVEQKRVEEIGEFEIKPADSKKTFRPLLVTKPSAVDREREREGRDNESGEPTGNDADAITVKEKTTPVATSVPTTKSRPTTEGFRTLPVIIS